MSKPSDFKNKIYSIISSGRLHNAIAIIRDRLEVLHDHQGIDILNRISSTYSFLLRFLREGNPDPQRPVLLNEIKENLYDLTERIDRAVIGKDSTELYYTSSRISEFSSLNFSEALGRFLSADAARNLSSHGSEEYKNSLTAQNMALKDIFNIVWTMAPGNNKDIDSIVNVSTDSDISFSLRGILVGGLIMNLLHTYDRAKFNALLSIETRTESEKIRARALTGIALVLDKYPSRIKSDPVLASRFETLADDLGFYTRMREVIYSLAKARGAVNYLRKMQKDIIPDIRKFGPDLFNNIKNDDGGIDIEKLEENPEWSKIMESTGMEKKLRRLTEMQSSGADMMLSMFEQVSRNFFFNDIDAWFRPFAEWEAERMGMPEELLPVLEAFSLNPGICDSDKFAMVSNLQRIPEAARALLRSTFEAQASQLSEDVKSMMLHTSTPEFDIECYNFARTLFRFFNFFRAKREFDNPFERAQRFKDWPFIGNILAEKEIMSAVGEYYYLQGFFEDAADVFRSLINYEVSDDWKAFCLQKIGCCLEKLDRRPEAREIFIEAFSYAPSDEWLAKKIVKVSEAIGEFTPDTKDALLMLYFRDKDNLRFLLPLAQFESEGWSCETSDGKPVKFLDRAAYIAPDNHEVIRLIAIREIKRDADRASAEKALSIMRPLLDNAEMLLASLSLSERMGEMDLSGEAESVEDIVLDLHVILFLKAFLGDDAGCVTVLSGLKTLLKDRFSLTTVENNIRRLFPKSDITEMIIASLPLYADAIEY